MDRSRAAVLPQPRRQAADRIRGGREGEHPRADDRVVGSARAPAGSMTMADMTAIPHPTVLPKLSRRAVFWLAAAAIWTLFPILSALQAASYSSYVGEAVQWRELLPIRLADWYTCAIFTPLFFWLVRGKRGVAAQLAAVAGAV